MFIYLKNKEKEEKVIRSITFNYKTLDFRITSIKGDAITKDILFPIIDGTPYFFNNGVLNKLN